MEADIRRTLASLCAVSDSRRYLMVNVVLGDLDLGLDLDLDLGLDLDLDPGGCSPSCLEADIARRGGDAMVNVLAECLDGSRDVCLMD